MSVLDTFTFVLKPDDKGVEAKLDSIEGKAKSVGKVTEGLSQNFSDFGRQMRDSITQVIPGSDRLLDTLGKIGGALRSVRTGAGEVNSRLRLGGMPPGGNRTTSGGTTPTPSPRPSVAASAVSGGGGGVGGAVATEGAAAAAGLSAVGVASAGVAVVLALLAVGAATLTKAFLDGVKSLSDSRKAATEAGVTNTQMAATEQFAKSMRLSADDGRNALKEISKSTQEGWVKSREFGNIFGIGNEQTQLLKKNGIRTTDERGELRNSTAIFEDIGKKMKTMSRDSGIAFGQFFGMTKDFATGVYDNSQSLSQFAEANRESIAAQAQAMVEVKKYEQAQQALANAWDDFAIKVGGKVIPVLTDLINWFVDAVPEIEAFGQAVYGQIMMIKDTALEVLNWLNGMRTKFIDGIFGEGATSQSDAAIKEGLSTVAGTIGDAFKRGMDASREYAKRGDTPTDAADFDREFRQNTSLNAKAANIQLEAANLMKTATAKFGLSMEQYLAMWAATSGRASGLRDSGGVTNSEFRDAYRDVTSRYATPEVAVALYGRGQPMMQQMPAQYAVGLGVSPQGIPRNAQGLGNAKQAVRDTSGLIGPGAKPFGGNRDKKTIEQVTIGDIHINTRSTDPKAINEAVSGSLVDNMKFALNKLNDGQIA